MPAAIAIPLITSAAAAGATVAGSAINARANSKAATLQSNAADRALDFEKQNHAEIVRDFAPYQQASARAIPLLTDFLAKNRPASVYGSGPIAPGPPAMSLSALAPQSRPAPQGQPMAAQAAPQGTVLMKAPTGQVQRVPAALVKHYTELGAQPVGA